MNSFGAGVKGSPTIICKGELHHSNGENFKDTSTFLIVRRQNLSTLEHWHDFERVAVDSLQIAHHYTVRQSG